MPKKILTFKENLYFSGIELDTDNKHIILTAHTQQIAEQICKDLQSFINQPCLYNEVSKLNTQNNVQITCAANNIVILAQDLNEAMSLLNGVAQKQLISQDQYDQFAPELLTEALTIISNMETKAQEGATLKTFIDNYAQIVDIILRADVINIRLFKSDIQWPRPDGWNNGDSLNLLITKYRDYYRTFPSLCRIDITNKLVSLLGCAVYVTDKELSPKLYAESESGLQSNSIELPLVRNMESKDQLTLLNHLLRIFERDWKFIKIQYFAQHVSVEIINATMCKVRHDDGNLKQLEALNRMLKFFVRSAGLEDSEPLFIDHEIKLDEGFILLEGDLLKLADAQFFESEQLGEFIRKNILQAKNFNLTIVQERLKSGDLKNHNWQCHWIGLFRVAFETKNYALMKELLAYCVNKDFECFSPLRFFLKRVINKKDFTMINLLLNYGFYQSHEGRKVCYDLSEVKNALKNDDLNIVRLLLNYQVVSKDSNSCYLTCEAVDARNLNAGRLLVQYGAKVTGWVADWGSFCQGELAPLTVAKNNGDYKFVRFLMAAIQCQEEEETSPGKIESVYTNAQRYLPTFFNRQGIDNYKGSLSDLQVAAIQKYLKLNCNDYKAIYYLEPFMQYYYFSNWLSDVTKFSAKIYDIIYDYGIPNIDHMFLQLRAQNSPGVKSYNLSENNFGNISWLSKSYKLERLYLCNTKVNDLWPLIYLPLRVLHLTNTPLEDIRPLIALKDTLVELDISNTKIKDFSPLFSLLNLETLWMTNVRITAPEISRLKELPKLKELHIDSELQATKNTENEDNKVKLI